MNNPSTPLRGTFTRIENRKKTVRGRFPEEAEGCSESKQTRLSEINEQFPVQALEIISKFL